MDKRTEKNHEIIIKKREHTSMEKKTQERRDIEKMQQVTMWNAVVLHQ